jgi:hypothetical protein
MRFSILDFRLPIATETNRERKSPPSKKGAERAPSIGALWRREGGLAHRVYRGGIFPLRQQTLQQK